MSEFNEQIIAESIDYLIANYNEQPDLSYLASRAGYEKSYFQKIFKEKVGISPKRLNQFMNLRHASELLVDGRSQLEVSQDTGLSGTGRLYDLFVSLNAVTPGEFSYKGNGVKVIYGYHSSPIGELMIGKTDKGVCYLGFLVDQDKHIPFQKMLKHLPEAEFVRDDKKTQGLANEVMQIWRGKGQINKKIKLDLYGTNLQIQVWKALLKIPVGRTRTYKDIAIEVGNPKGARAIGNAVGANPISLLIPCHRVIRKSGIVDNYGWGSPRKKFLLGLEGEVF
jgi:AraC family transcriptional regulator of adaptative response/methylated-DNA-[protein]-cysteine methyltransferase